MPLLNEQLAESRPPVVEADANNIPASGASSGRPRRKLSILGTRGIPAQHGGFESFAERLAIYLAQRDWDITVYCQETGQGPIYEDCWRGVRLVHVPVRRDDAWGTIAFDWHSTRHAARRPGSILTLGYNTALFTLLYKLRRKLNLINMDGIEWQRAKWSLPQRAWLWFNERCGCWLGDLLIADHPCIEMHLASRVSMKKIRMIPYGADLIDSADATLLKPLGLSTRGYALVVARPEPENSLLEIVTAFSRRKRGLKLCVLGRYEPQRQAYHREVMQAASDEVLFPGAIYDQATVAALRYHARLYVHGHTVGGTNPALVEALGAGCPVLAHDNAFNRWVAGPEAQFFSDIDQCDRAFDQLLANDARLHAMRLGSRGRCESQFTWNRILHEYESLLSLLVALPH